MTNVFDFKYLGFTFSADGDFRQAISVRMAQAKARFGQLWQIWGSELPRSAQINLYAAAVIAMLIHGHQAWPLTDKVLKSLKHFNANCILAKITGDPHDTYYRNQAEYFDIEGILRARRLDWVGRTLRTTIPSLAHTSFFIIKKDISLCYGLGMDMVHQDFPFQSIREKEFKREIKEMANA